MTDTSEKFLIDANAIITPYLSYYPFDFAPKFWGQLEAQIENGTVVILDLVKKEVEKGNDPLSQWMKNILIADIIDHRESTILGKYSEVLAYIQTSDCYNSKALAEWSQNNVADPWLIAAGSTYGYTIITFERPAGGLNAGNPSGHPKIPDVCSKFGVKYKDLYYMMRQLSFMLG
jgi:hypothetical protein